MAPCWASLKRIAYGTQSVTHPYSVKFSQCDTTHVKLCPAEIALPGVVIEARLVRESKEWHWVCWNRNQHPFGLCDSMEVAYPLVEKLSDEHLVQKRAAWVASANYQHRLLGVVIVVSDHNKAATDDRSLGVL